MEIHWSHLKDLRPDEVKSTEAVHGGLRFEELEEGQRVGLDVEPGDQGLQANAVVPPPPGTPSP